MSTPDAPSLRVLGVDPGLRVTGWAVVAQEGDEPQLVDCGAIKTNASRSLPQRLLQVHEALTAVLRQWCPLEVAVEEPFVAANKRSAMVIGEARAVALLAAAQAGVTVQQYPPTEVKLVVTGHGGSDKSQVQAMLCVQLGLAEPPGSADAADAAAVALCHLVRRRREALVAAREKRA